MQKVLMNKWVLRAGVVVTPIIGSQAWQMGKAAASGWAKR